MKQYQKDLALLLAESQALFFKKGLSLKDGRPTPYFVNFGFVRTGSQISALGSIMAEYIVDKKLYEQFDVLLGPSYKGSALAVATVEALWSKYEIDKSFEYDRKEAKTHGEASQKAANFVTGALHDGSKVLIIDDVVTSMATKFEILEALNSEAKNKAEVYHNIGVVLYMDRQQTTAVYDDNNKLLLERAGHDAVKNFTEITGLPVSRILGIRETVDYLYKEKIPVSQNTKLEPLRSETLEVFNKYSDIYGMK